MRRSLVALLVAGALAAAASAVSAANGDPSALWRENLRLTAEVGLAQKPKMYFILDLEARTIALKTRGMVLKEIPIVAAGVWGWSLQIGPRRVVQKDALVPPARPAITPGEEKTAENLDESILELKNMPTAYRLLLEGDVEIEVLPVVEGKGSRLRQQAYLWAWRLTRPLVTLKGRRERRESTSLYLILEPVDAQSLYWSFYEGLEGIVVPPVFSATHEG